MKYIKLNQKRGQQGFRAKVDDADYPALSRFNWSVRNARGRAYAFRMVTLSPYNDRLVFMHRVILYGEGGGPRVDHRNGDGLDNRRRNIRRATQSQNMSNTKLYANNKSGYRGVFYVSGTDSYTVSICYRGVRRYLGTFKSARAASRAYRAEAIRTFGAFCPDNVRR